MPSNKFTRAVGDSSRKPRGSKVRKFEGLILKTVILIRFFANQIDEHFKVKGNQKCSNTKVGDCVNFLDLVFLEYKLASLLKPSG